VADSHALYAVWGGANDLFVQLGLLQTGAINAAQLQSAFLGVAGAEIGQVRRLTDAGARFVAVFTLPNVGATPQFAGGPFAASVAALSAGYNTTLFTGLQSAGIRVIPVDTFSLFNEILANPATFGFSNTTGTACGPFPPFATTANSFFCYAGNLVAPGADQSYVFADSVHPTTASHRIIAQFVESLIEGPTQYGLLAEAPLRMRSSHIRSIGDGLARNRQDEVGKFGVFLGGDGGDFDIESSTGNSGMTNRIRSGTVGITMRASESVTLGLAHGRSSTTSTFGQDAGHFNTMEHAWSVFGSVRWGGFYGVGVLSTSAISTATSYWAPTCAPPTRAPRAATPRRISPPATTSPSDAC